MRNDDGGEHIFCYTVPDQRSPICASNHAGPSMICSIWPSHSAGSSSLTTTGEPQAANPDLLKKMEVECVLKESTALESALFQMQRHTCLWVVPGIAGQLH